MTKLAEYIYLGQIISFNKQVQKELEMGDAISRKKCWSSKFVLVDKVIKINFRRQEMNNNTIRNADEVTN